MEEMGEAEAGTVGTAADMMEAAMEGMETGLMGARGQQHRMSGH